MKRGPLPLIIREMHIKTAVRYYFTPVQNGHHQKNLQIINAGEGVETRQPTYTVSRN